MLYMQLRNQVGHEESEAFSQKFKFKDISTI